MRKIMLILALLVAGPCLADSYNPALRATFWNDLYPDGGWTFYCNERFEPGDHRGLNIEHVYPASWMAKHLGCGTRVQCRKTSDLFNTMEADMRNLWPALAQYNQIRSNYPYSEIPGNRWKYSGCDFEFKGNLVEPSNRIKGQIARSMLYMAVKYGLPINRDLMERWSIQYPMTDSERRRNNRIAEIQNETE
jgi:deoxyribonuclease I